jgi:hypothetical protein
VRPFRWLRLTLIKDAHSHNIKLKIYLISYPQTIRASELQLTPAQLYSSVAIGPGASQEGMALNTIKNPRFPLSQQREIFNLAPAISCFSIQIQHSDIRWRQSMTW